MTAVARTTPAPAAAVLGTRLTKDQAFEQRMASGHPPQLGEVFDEASQEWMPLGAKLALDRAVRLADPVQQLSDFKRTRDALMLFIREELEEAEYQRNGYPVAGALHDFYTMPDFNGKRAITKQGAEKVADLRRWRKSASNVTACTETKEYVSARVNVQLVDAMGQPVGAYEAACSSAEKGFQSPGTQEKYGAKYKWENDPNGGRARRTNEQTQAPDWRGGLNDIVARAGVRAFRGAVLVAAAMDEIFDIALSTGAEDEATGGEAEQTQPQPTQPQHAAPAPEPVKVTLESKVPFGKHGPQYDGGGALTRPAKTVRGPHPRRERRSRLG